MSSGSRAFTLVEVLIVLAIVAIVATALLFVLNPAELLRKGRDASRLSDLRTLQTAIQSYIASQSGSALSIGSSTVTYLSIPDPTATSTAGTDCFGLNDPAIAPGGSFHCAASSTYRDINGEGWLPIDFRGTSLSPPLAALPVDPVNTTSSGEFYIYQTNGTSFKITAYPESQTYLAQAGINADLFVAGTDPGLAGGYWVMVPGNSAFGTNNFYVMKYDATCSDGSGNYLNDQNSGIDTYNDSALNCDPANGRQIAALPGGWPVDEVTASSSKIYCASIGAHLLTNAEWQTIAWNAEGVGSNWTGGTPGSGAINAGHSDNVPANPLPAAPSDSESCFGTDGPASCGGIGTNPTQIRTFTLSDGSVIWDMAGNINQMTSDLIEGAQQPHGSTSGWNWYEYTDPTMAYNSMTQDEIGPINPSWNSSQGIGELFSENSSADLSIYVFLRGGYWGGGGIEDLVLDRPSYTSNNGASFRCAR